MLSAQLTGHTSQWVVGKRAVYAGDWGPLATQATAEAIEAMANTADAVRLSPIGGCIGNLISLGVNLGSALYWTP